MTGRYGAGDADLDRGRVEKWVEVSELGGFMGTTAEMGVGVVR